jgi:hypothetical protein
MAAVVRTVAVAVPAAAAVRMVVADLMAAVDSTAAAGHMVVAGSAAVAVYHMAVVPLVEAAFIAVAVSVIMQECMPPEVFAGQQLTAVVWVAVQPVSGAHTVARYVAV